MKKILLLLTLVCVVLGSFPVSAATLYSTDGRTINVPDEQIEVWERVGWYRESNTILVYAEDGRIQRIPTVAFNAWHSVGWYSAPVMRIYNCSGENHVILKSDYSQWSKVGWMNAPMQTIYADILDAAYKIAKINWSSAYPSYVYYDINKDGVKEVIIDNGLYEAGRFYDIYTIVDSKVSFVGTIGGSHSMLSHYPNKNGVLIEHGHMGYYGIRSVSMVNGKLVEKTVLDEKYYTRDYPDASSVVKGAYPLDMTYINK